MGHYDIFCYFFNIEKCDLRTLRSTDRLLAAHITSAAEKQLKKQTFS